MVLDLAFGKRAYDWLGTHPRVYGIIRWTVAFGREDHLQRRALESLGLKEGDTVLDLACGSGVNLPALVRAVGASGRIIATDYSDGMLNTARATARRMGWNNVEFIQADAATLELAPQSLDGALCTFALSAMPGERAALQRVAQALKPAARFVALDAKTFTGPARVLNPVTGPLFKYTTNWNYQKDVVGVIHEVFPEVEVAEYHQGANFIAVAGNLTALPAAPAATTGPTRG